MHCTEGEDTSLHFDIEMFLMWCTSVNVPIVKSANRESSGEGMQQKNLGRLMAATFKMTFN